MIITKIQGGLGNQLFQYATGRALSLKYNAELKFDLAFFENPEYIKVFRLDKFKICYDIANSKDCRFLKNKAKIPTIFKILKKLNIKIHPFYKKSHLIEDDVLSLLKKRNVKKKDYYFECWHNNENYFKTYRKTIIQDLNADFLLSKENLLLQQELINNNSISVHIRRGDYLTNPYFKVIPKEYYLKAMKYFINQVQDPIFYFFSDDIAWVKKEFSNFSNVKFIESNSFSDTVWSSARDIEDLMLLRSCKHQIIANSSFSWWGAWLNENPNKIVIAPKYWYNNIKAQHRIDFGNLIPSDWIKLY